MSIELLKNNMPEYAKDIKLNLAVVLSEAGSAGLTQKQILAIALASSYATKNADVIAAITAESNAHLTEAEINSQKSAASIMAMNNVYYRFLHLVNLPDFNQLPAKLRMNVIANPGIDKIDFELSCLAVSVINGCGMCMESHTQALMKAGLDALSIQSVVRIASVINASAMALMVA